ncbi:MAG TPA: MFS transporter [Anaerolineales bacterium]|nr:MFS transporter [Anaerolineales bacterium]
MFQNINTHYVQPMRTFNRDARLFLWMTVINGIILSGWQLFFNIYMLESGFTREFLGIINSLPSLTALLLGIPIGRLSDRIGRKQALIIGILFSGLTFLGQVTFKQPAIIIMMAALTGIFNMFVIVSISPLMMKLSDEQNRTLLFSLNYGLQTLAGAVGSLFAGQLPALFESFLGVGKSNAIAYQAILILMVILGTTALIPLWKMSEPKTLPTQLEPGSRKTGLLSGLTRMTVKLATPNFLIGVGAAILIPYMNVFFKDRFAISDSLLGLLFSLSSLFIGVGSLIGPRLSTRLGGKIRTVAFTQLGSVVFMLMIGFVPSLWVAGFSYLMRAALMNMSAPLYSAFCMEKTPAHQQGVASSVLNVAWLVGWSVGPYISGVVQQRYGFSPLFIATTILYLIAVGVMWRMFHNEERRQAVPAVEEPSVILPEG